MMLLVLQLSVICEFFRYCSRYERCSNSPEPLANEIINTIDQVVNENSPETPNLENMTNEVPAQDSNDSNKKQRTQKCLSYIIQIEIKICFNINHF